MSEFNSTGELKNGVFTPYAPAEPEPKAKAEPKPEPKAKAEPKDDKKK